MSCPTCSGTVQCVSCRMEGRPPPKLRAYPGRRPHVIPFALRTATMRENDRRKDDEDLLEAENDHRTALTDTERGRGEP